MGNCWSERSCAKRGVSGGAAAALGLAELAKVRLLPGEPNELTAPVERGAIFLGQGTDLEKVNPPTVLTVVMLAGFKKTMSCS